MCLQIYINMIFSLIYQVFWVSKPHKEVLVSKPNQHTTVSNGLNVIICELFVSKVYFERLTGRHILCIITNLTFMCITEARGLKGKSVEGFRFSYSQNSV